MRTAIARSLLYFSAAFLFFAATATAGADGAKPVAAGPDRVAIRGYDTVAYFTDGKATKGSSSFEYAWDDAKWRFASADHRDMFIADPDRYAPQFGGFCAGAITGGVLMPANPEAWVIVGGKLYMVAGSQADLAEWKADAAENIKQGDKQWPVAQARWGAQQP
jgi:hypothetical protein